MLAGKNSMERMKEITDRLEEGIQELFQSERYRSYLSAMSRFHHYSYNNVLLILMQMPEASLIAGANTWKKGFGRYVKKGERAIRILAPAPYKKRGRFPKLDPDTGKLITDENGGPVLEEKEITVPAFKIVSVFDISQTEGRELPTFGVDELTGNVEHFSDFTIALEKASPVPIQYEDISDGSHGYYHLLEKRIAIKSGMSELQTMKTIIHEIAHARLHAIGGDIPNSEDEVRADRSTKEVQAESVAYVVCQHYGLDTSEYSFGYVVGWSSGKEMSELKASLEVIRKASHELIMDIDRSIMERQNEQNKKDITVERLSDQLYDSFSFVSGNGKIRESR